MSSETDLTGKLLIAMPGMGDPRFAHSVVLMCAYSPEGAMGLIINKVTEELRLDNLLEQLSIPKSPMARDLPVHFGGPVEHGRGFVLHDPSYESAISTLEVTPEFSMTATMDILEDMAQGLGPSDVILALGYAGWGPGSSRGRSPGMAGSSVMRRGTWCSRPRMARNGRRRWRALEFRR